eukprot:5685443-Alexandrium_andersonii.AAC.1
MAAARHAGWWTDAPHPAHTHTHTLFATDRADANSDEFNKAKGRLAMASEQKPIDRLDEGK